MKTDETRAVAIRVADGEPVSGLFQSPSDACACYVLAHGAGAGMNHPFMAAVADGLVQRGIATLRYQFPYMEKGSKRPVQPKVAHAAVRAAVAEAGRLAPGLPLFAGGKSFGGRMTSQAQAEEPLPGVNGLIFLGFPLHPAGKPSDERAKQLFDMRIPIIHFTSPRAPVVRMLKSYPSCSTHLRFGSVRSEQQLAIAMQGLRRKAFNASRMVLQFLC